MKKNKSSGFPLSKKIKPLVQNPNSNFRKNMILEFEKFIRQQKSLIDTKNSLRIDLHCHDRNSNVPDEILGRLLDIPETWLETRDLLSALEKNGCNAFTITNHNNARSCYEMQDKGLDILTGAEFTCRVPDFNTRIHVLAYGFTPSQEAELFKKRSDLYRFLRYAAENKIPVIWAHPFYFYSGKGTPPVNFFEKLSLVFERFEAVNGQRNTRQNLLIKSWVGGLSPEKLSYFAKKYSVNPADYCQDPNRKVFSGGSDSHMGIFSGLTGTLLEVPDLQNRITSTPVSELSLEAIRECRMAPFGTHNESERLMVAFLDYFCQIAINMKDPGMIRILLHKGNTSEKLTALLAGNAFLELKRHKVTMGFLQTFHECFRGNVPAQSRKFLIKPAYRKIFTTARNIAKIRRDSPWELTPEYLNAAILQIYQNLSQVFFSRLEAKMNKFPEKSVKDNNFENLIRSIEIPLEFQRYAERPGKGKIKNFNFKGFLDGLSFPLLGSSVIYAAAFAGTRVMNTSRDLLDEISDRLAIDKQPGRALWLTDTFSDQNGVAHSLRKLHQEIKARNLPIDILVCSDTIEPDDHLIVIPPAFTFKVPMYQNQDVRIPDILQIHRIFDEGYYDRLVCSTEGPMAIISVLLKHAFSIPAWFFLHTDWLTFARINLKSDIHMQNRFRRILRALYRQFDGLFVLNTDQEKWLTGREMGLPRENVFKTAHWVDKKFHPKPADPCRLFGTGSHEKILLYVGRINDEKGIPDLLWIYETVKKKIETVRLVIVGSGPAENNLQNYPDIVHIPWIENDRLPEIYSSADIFVFPSVFDTFGLVVLESLACGLPVATYPVMGPGEIVINNKCGYTSKTRLGLSEAIVSYLNSPEKAAEFRQQSIERSRDFSVDAIIDKLLKNTALRKN